MQLGRCEAAAARAISLDTCLRALVYPQACGSEPLLAAVHRFVDERLPDLVSTPQWREFKRARESDAAELIERTAVATFGQLKRVSLAPPLCASRVKRLRDGRPLQMAVSTDGDREAAQPGGAAAAAPAAADSEEDDTRSSNDASDAPSEDEERRCRSRWSFPILDAGTPRGPESFCHDIPDRDPPYVLYFDDPRLDG
jgi:hypothetical protein